MLSVHEVQRRVLASVRLVEPVDAAIEESLGRCAAQPVLCQRTLPFSDTSAMDGYALRSVDTPGRLTVVATLPAGGRAHGVSMGPGQCARVATGAPVPEGADAVVMQEAVTREGEQLSVIAPVPAGSFVRRRGEDATQGQVLLPAGHPIGLAEAGALWAQGLTSVRVHRRPRVAIAASGDELVAVGASGDGPVDTNSPMLALAVHLAGGSPTALGLAGDRLDAVTELFARGLDHDVLLTVAGASVGERDFTRRALEALGVDVEGWKVAMKPGKPFMLGRRGATVVFGLPGNPVSALVTFELFVRPALRAMQGLPPLAPRLPGLAAEPIAKAPGLAHFVRATVETRDGALWAHPLRTQSSGALSSATSATHLIALPEGSGDVDAGAPISLIPLSWVPTAQPMHPIGI